jgi:hypothetical protein
VQKPWVDRVDIREIILTFSKGLEDLGGERRDKIGQAFGLQTESQKSREEAGGGDVFLAGWVSLPLPPESPKLLATAQVERLEVPG